MRWLGLGLQRTYMPFCKTASSPGPVLSAEGTGIDLEDGNAAPRELPIKAPTVVLALEDSGDAQMATGIDWLIGCMIVASHQRC